MKNNKNTSDGYHTFKELYEHRYILFIALCKKSNNVWKSLKHHNGTMFKNSFILGINKNEGEQITYHLPLKKWNDCYFAETLDFAPKYDKHCSNDVLERIKKL